MNPTVDTAKIYNRMRDGRCNFQRDEAIKLANEVGIPTDRPGTIEDIYFV